MSSTSRPPLHLYHILSYTTLAVDWIAFHSFKLTITCIIRRVDVFTQGAYYPRALTESQGFAL